MRSRFNALFGEPCPWACGKRIRRRNWFNHAETQHNWRHYEIPIG